MALVLQAPIEFMLDGILESGEEIGLRLVEGYRVRPLKLQCLG